MTAHSRPYPESHPCYELRQGALRCGQKPLSFKGLSGFNKLETIANHPYMTKTAAADERMILYDLICKNDHEFESWFKSSSAYDALRKTNNVSCPHCGTTSVRKAPMAPSISKGGRSQDVPVPDLSANAPEPPAETTEDMAVVMNKAVEAIKELQETIEKKFENVGDKFPEEARKIHYGEAEARGIYGEATPDEAQDLIDEGVEIAAVPWQKRRTS